MKYKQRDKMFFSKGYISDYISIKLCNQKPDEKLRNNEVIRQGIVKKVDRKL